MESIHHSFQGISLTDFLNGEEESNIKEGSKMSCVKFHSKHTKAQSCLYMQSLPIQKCSSVRVLDTLLDYYSSR